MDSLVDRLFSIKDSLQDGLLVLPHLLSGFFFFIGILTSNIGMLCLAMGHFIIVPSLSFFANNEWPYFIGDKFNVGGVAFSLLPTVVLIIASLGSTWAWPAWLILLMHIVKFILSSTKPQGSTLFDALNPLAWTGDIKKKTESAIDVCFLSPEETFTKEPQRRTPSGWTLHLIFFTSFLLANASRLYAMPVPVSKSTDPAVKENIDIRVNNRKIITGTIIGLSLAILAILLYIRFSMSPCENTIYESLFPMLFCFTIGFSYYTLLTDSCGIPASDILGLVQGFISPTAIDNPIVCIGTDPGPLSTQPTRK
jgi:hypothetical protein